MDEFMNHPLVVWVKTFKDGSALDYMDLVDGVFLNDVMGQIDSRPSNLKVNTNVDGEINLRIQNLDTLLKNIKSFYQEMMEQLIVMKLPHILTIAKDPLSEVAIAEMQKLILLLLGCAVQCDKKEVFIERIKQLEIDVQHAIVVHIQEVTDNSENVFSLQLEDIADLPPDQQEGISKNMFNHLKSLAKERDDYSEAITEICQEKEFYQAQLEGRRVPATPSPTSPIGDSRRHITVELAETKAKLRRTRQELEEKTELVLEYKDEIEKCNATMQKLRHENLELTQDARSVRAYRDELDVWKEKASKVEKYEIEITRYRERLNELDYLKRRTEELREDNQLLHETKSMLEEQLDTAHHKVEKGRDAESELLRIKAQLETMQEDKDADRKRIQELVEEVAILQLDHKRSLNESVSLGAELEIAKTLTSPLGGNLKSEYDDSASSRILRLEKENQRLIQELENFKDTTSFEHNSRVLEMEKENQRLGKKVEILQTATTKDMQKYLELEQEINKLRRERETLTDTIGTVKENAERQTKEWDAEKEMFNKTIETLRERNIKDIDQRVQDVEKENKKLCEDVKETQSRISQMQHENKQLQKAQERLKETSTKLEELEKQNLELESEKDKLTRNIATLKLMCDKQEELEKCNSELELEKRKLEKSLETLKSRCEKMDHVESEIVQLRADNQRLQRSLETVKGTASKVTQLEHDKEELDRQNRQLQKSMVSLKSFEAKVSQLEVDNMKLENENKRLETVIQLSKQKVEKLERETQELDSEVELLRKQVDAAKLSEKKVEVIEKNCRTLELQKMSVDNEVSLLQKENKRLKHSLQARDNLVDEANARAATLEQDHKQLQKTVTRHRDSGDRVKELEKENKDILKQVTMDKKTLASLREELVKEKITTQQLSNELEKLTTELDKIGLDKEKLLQEELSSDESRYKALENRMEDTLKKSLEIKEEKVVTLETRLKESKSRNQKISDELRSLKREHTSLLQRVEEDQVQSAAIDDKSPDAPKFKRQDSDRIHARQIMQMKDHLVELERTNATLLAENTSLKTQLDNLTVQVKVTKSENTTLHSKDEEGQEQNIGLQSKLAKLQVENSTIASQKDSMQFQYKSTLAKMSVQDGEFEKLKERFEELDNNYEALLNDHETLVALHDTLANEHEILITEHGTLKATHRSARTELQDWQNRLAEAEKRLQDVASLQNSLQKEEQKYKKLRYDNQEMNTLVRDLNSLTSSHTRLNQEYSDVEEELRALKQQHRNLQLEHTSLQGELSEAKDQVQTVEMDNVKLEHKCEMLNQMNANLEEENRRLMEQLSQLMAQNAELLVQTLETKELHHEDHRALEEQLHNLRRQKEKLEEKIMDQYKTPPKKHKGGLNLNFLKKIHRSRNKDKEKRKSRNFDQSLHLSVDHTDGHHDGSSLGENSSQGSEVNSLDGSPRPVQSLEDRRPSDEPTTSTPQRRRLETVPTSGPNRLSMLEERGLHSSGAFSMSMGDLRTQGSLTASQSMTVLDKRGLARKDDENSPTTPTEVTTPTGEGKAVPGNGSGNSNPENDGIFDDEASPRLYTKSGNRTERRGSAMGMLSRIKSRSREILDDMRSSNTYGSTPNLARDITFSEEDRGSPATKKNGKYTPVEYTTGDESSLESSPRVPEEETPPAPPKPQRQHPEEEPIVVATASENLQSAPPPLKLVTNNNSNHATNGAPDDENNTFQTSPTNGSTPSPVRPTTLTSPAYSARPYPGRQESNSPRIISPQKATGGKLIKPKPQYPPGSPKRAMKDSTTGTTESNNQSQPRVGRVKPNNRPISIVSPESSRSDN
ncbi:girdin-like isoform X3 [Amphiura filiformis]|uniref:girdin-like isoform X3 n=1 Tax=Amphiura filiformis TaxID=82378 RepID=UPI003B21D810